jgi:hypothetical protein
MNFTIGTPVLAAGVQELLFVVVMIISFIAWVIRQVQGTNQQLPPPVQRPGRRREEQRDDEIDSFLEQVNRNQAPARSSRPETSRNQPAVTRNKPATSASAVTPPTPAKQRQPTRQLAEGLPSAALPSTASPRQHDVPMSARNVPTNQGMAPPQSQSKPVQLSDRNVKEPQNLGKSLAQQSPAIPTATAAVPTNLGSFRAAVPAIAAQTPAQLAGAASPEAATNATFLARTNNLRQALRNPQMIKQAIIVQEILGRPKCLRK